MTIFQTVILPSVVLLNFVGAADISYMRKTITDHFSENRNHFVNKTYKDAAMKFIFEEFQRFGLDTEYNNFTSNSPRLVSPPDTESTFTNVVGVLKGSNFGTAQDRIIGVGAHYDTMKTTKGVDDNGAGVAAMLESARQITQMKTKRANTIIFASFDVEEYDLTGSRKFIETWVNPWLVSNYGSAAQSIQPYGVIVLDTMMEFNTSQNSQIIPPTINSTFFPDTLASVSSDGFQGDFLTLIYRKPTSDAALADVFTSFWENDNRREFELEAMPLPFSVISQDIIYSFWDLFRSDHTNFWLDNIPAIFITDSADYRGDMRYCYHKMCDDLETMLTDDNINFLGKTADTIVKTINSLSDPETSGANNSFQSTSLVFSLIVSAVLTSIYQA